MVELVLDKVKQWLAADEFYAVEDVDISKYATVFHRNLYTFGEKGEVFLKFKLLNKKLKGLDEVALLLTHACMYRADIDEYLEVAGEIGGEVAVIGVLSERYIKKNNYSQYDASIPEASDSKIVSIENFSLKSVGDFDKHLSCADVRVRKDWQAIKPLISSKYPY